jgi:hypothetical protein
MAKGRLFRIFCLQILLIALAIQGITPDAGDLASVNALKLFCPALTDSDQPVNDDDFPDDVCEPLLIETDFDLCHLEISDNLPFLTIAATEAQSGIMTSDSLRCVPRHGTLNSIDGRIHFLSPLIC